MRSKFDSLYGVGAVLGGVCLAAILVLVVVQVVARWLGVAMAGIPEFSGYAMAGSFFLPLAYTFRSGAHIRITIILDRVPAGSRWAFEAVVLAAAFALSAYLAAFMVRLVHFSLLINDISQGADATPLWIPQLAMGVGSVLLAMAVGQTLLEHVTARDAVVRESFAE